MTVDNPNCSASTVDMASVCLINPLYASGSHAVILYCLAKTTFMTRPAIPTFDSSFMASLQVPSNSHIVDIFNTEVHSSTVLCGIRKTGKIFNLDLMHLWPNKYE